MSLCGLPGCNNAAYLDKQTCRFHIGMERFIEPPNLGAAMNPENAAQAALERAMIELSDAITAPRPPVSNPVLRCQNAHCECDEQARAACDARLNAPKPVPATPERGAGLKFDGGKPRWTLMMKGLAYALSTVVAVLTFGARKYAAHSWRKVENGPERYRDALYRHLAAYEAGEVNDPESGLPHMAHVATNAMFLLELDKGRGL